VSRLITDEEHLRYAHAVASLAAVVVRAKREPDGSYSISGSILTMAARAVDAGTLAVAAHYDVAYWAELEARQDFDREEDP
jgi:hypothetical protein